MKSQTKVMERLVKVQREEQEILSLVASNGMSIQYESILHFRLKPLIDTLKWGLENFREPGKLENKLHQLYTMGYKAYEDMIYYNTIEYESKCKVIRSRQLALEYILDLDTPDDNPLY